MNKYDKIIHASRPESKHPKMSIHDRAAQFMPFAALTGYDDQIQDAARLTDQKRELSEDEKAQVNENLNILKNLVYTRPIIKGYRFIKDNKKEGGHYETFEGVLQRFDELNQLLVLKDGTRIKFSDLVEVELKNE